MWLVIDDLQWSDDLSLEALGHLVARSDLGLCLLAGFRAEESGDRLEPLLRSASSGVVKVVDLGRLDRTGVESMVGSMLAMKDVPDRFVDFLQRSSEGNPFFVAEYLHAAVAEGLLSRDPQGEWHLPPLDDAEPSGEDLMSTPEAIRRLVARRVGSLSASARRMVAQAAVFGRRVSARRLSEALEISDPAAEEELIRQHVLDEEPPYLSFTHDKLREGIYDSLPGDQRRNLHRRAARVLEEAGGERPAVMALHWERAGDPRRARDCYLAAGREAAAGYAMAAAERHYRSVVRLAPDDPDLKARALHELGASVLEVAGRHRAAVEVLREALVLLDPDASATKSGAVNGGTARVEVARTRRALAESLRYQGELQESVENYREARRLYQALGDERGEARTLSRIAVVVQEQGDHRGAHEAYRLALPTLERLNDEEGVAEVLYSQATLEMEEGRYESAEDLCRRALEIYGRLGVTRRVGALHNNLGNLHRVRGRTEEASGSYQEALRCLRAVGDRSSEGLLRANLGASLIDVGRGEEAEEHLLKSRELLLASNSRLYLPVVTTNLGNLRWRQGRVEEALGWYEEGLDQARRSGSRRNEGVVLLLCAEAWRLTGPDLTRAAAMLKEGSEVLLETGKGWEWMRAICEAGHFALARGESAAAQLAEARRYATSEESGSMDVLIPRLEAAQRAFENGLPLWRGDVVQELGPGVQRFMKERGIGPGPMVDSGGPSSAD